LVGDYVQVKPCPVYYVTEFDMLGRIRATFDRNKDDPAQETEDAVFRQLLGAGLLIVDDVGKFRSYELSFTQKVYFRLLDKRMGNERPVILVTNLSTDELEQYLGGATADRLRGMCGEDGFIEITGPSQR